MARYSRVALYKVQNTSHKMQHLKPGTFTTTPGKQIQHPEVKNHPDMPVPMHYTAEQDTHLTPAVKIGAPENAADTEVAREKKVKKAGAKKTVKQASSKKPEAKMDSGLKTERSSGKDKKPAKKLMTGSISKTKKSAKASKGSGAKAAKKTSMKSTLKAGIKKTIRKVAKKMKPVTKMMKKNVAKKMSVKRRKASNR